MADGVKWIKIVVDVFNDEKISMIETLPDGDSIIVIWFKLLCLAGQKNNGGIFFMKEKVPYTEEMLSAIFRRPLNTVRFAIRTFEQYGMVEIIDNVITIPSWSKHQSEAKLSEMREYNKLAKRAERERRKLLVGGECIPALPEEKPIEEQNKDNVNDKSMTSQDSPLLSISVSGSESLSLLVTKVIKYLNEKADTNYRPSTDTTKKLIKARLNEGFQEEDFYTVIDKKVNEWINTTNAIYIRPETLFGNKFESYLNQRDSKPYDKNSIHKDYSDFENWGEQK